MNWQPQTVQDPYNLQTTANPVTVIQSERERLAELWHAHRTSANQHEDEAEGGTKRRLHDDFFANDPIFNAPHGGGTELPPITVEELREASLSFKRTTASTYDGFHVRHFAMLSDEALQCIAHLLMTCEACGQLPDNVISPLVVLIPKPKGGFRPIGIFTSIERLWAKVRRWHADKWQRDNFRHYLACAKGCGAADLVWRQTLSAEQSAHSQRQYAAVLWDLKEFFDHIDHRILWQRAIHHGYPRVLVRMAIAAYRAPRLVEINGRLARDLWPTCGVFAGHILAMSLVHLYQMEPLDLFLARNPRVQL